MNEIKHSDFHLISGAWDNFGGGDFTCSWQNIERENAQLLNDLASNISYATGIGATAGMRILGGPGAAAGAITGAIGGAVGTLGVALADKFPVNVEMPTVPISPNWINP